MPKLDLWTPHPVLFFQEQEKKWEVVSTRSGLFSPFTGGLMNCSIFITHVYDKLIEIRVANDWTLVSVLVQAHDQHYLI